jgi:protein-disulfide isomerase
MDADQHTKHQQPNQVRAPVVHASYQPSSGRSRRIYAGITLAVVILGVIAVAAQVQVSRSRASAAIPPVRVSASYPISLHNGVVIAGQPNAPIDVDVYEDFLCPLCKLFESAHDEKIQQALNAGRITVRYHVINLLEDRSIPPGYSLEAANAGLCAVESGVYPSYHASLYGTQPEEGTPGYTIDRLVELGRALNAQGAFERCVRSGLHNAQVKDQLAAAKDNHKLWQQTSSGLRFGTPTVLVNNQRIPVLDVSGSIQFDQWID